jgi:hypothetical protein
VTGCCGWARAAPRRRRWCGCGGGRARTTRVRCVSIFLDKNRRYIGKSQPKTAAAKDATDAAPCPPAGGRRPPRTPPPRPRPAGRSTPRRWSASPAPMPRRCALWGGGGGGGGTHRGRLSWRHASHGGGSAHTGGVGRRGVVVLGLIHMNRSALRHCGGGAPLKLGENSSVCSSTSSTLPRCSADQQHPSRGCCGDDNAEPSPSPADITSGPDVTACTHGTNAPSSQNVHARTGSAGIPRHVSLAYVVSAEAHSVDELLLAYERTAQGVARVPRDLRQTAV